jgi:hypothetical protein
MQLRQGIAAGGTMTGEILRAASPLRFDLAHNVLFGGRQGLVCRCRALCRAVLLAPFRQLEAPRNPIDVDVPEGPRNHASSRFCADAEHR